MTDTRSGGGARKRPKLNQHVTKSGKVIKVNQSLGARLKAKREARARSKAAYLSTLPQGRIKRTLYRLHPKRQFKYWFSREGLKTLVKVGGIAAVVGIITTLGVFAYFRKDLPNIKDASGNTLGGSNRYYDKTGTILLWEDFDSFKRIPVASDQISPHVKNGIIAIEDRDFYNHRGFNPRGITRAALSNTFGSSDGTQGGSTITQQLVKITQGYTEERTYTRKIKELILAIELERTNNKEDILVGYLNSAPFGGIEVGIEAAAQNYFNKSAKDLDLAESTMLTAIPQLPSRYSPYAKEYFRKEALIGRQHYTLDVMVEMGFITKEQADEAKKVDVLARVQPRVAKYENIKAPYFTTTAQREFSRNFTDKIAKRGGYKIITTIDMTLQQIAEEETAKGLRQIERQKGNTFAFVAADVRTSQVVAMVGGPDFNNKEKAGEVNFATSLLRPGSSIKPYDYAALMESSDKFGAGSVLYDTQAPLPGYPCTNKALPPKGNCLFNYSRNYAGPITLRYALGASLNVPAAKAFLIATPEKVQELIKKVGMPSGYNCYKQDSQVGVTENEVPCGAAASFGDGAYLRLNEHVNGYTALSRNGRSLPQTYILKVEDNGGKTLFEWKEQAGEQAIRPDTAYIVSDMLSDPNASFFANKIHRYKGHKFSIKTGTTGENKDAWMMGYSTQFAAGVWTGHHTSTIEMSGLSDTMTLPIWNGFMKRAHDNVQPVEREKPAGVQTLPAYVFRKKIYGNVVPSPSTDLYPSWYAGNKKASNKKSVIDIVSEKLATDCTPERAKKEISEGDANIFSGDTFVTGAQGANTGEKDDVHACEDAKPSISLAVQDNGGGSYTFRATVGQGTHPLSSEKFAGAVNFKIDGQILPGGSFQVESPGVIAFNYTADRAGERTVVAEVVDSVLYDASDSKSLSFLAGSPLTITSPTAGQNVGNNVTVSWTGGTGPYTAKVNGVDAPTCTNIAGTSCNVVIANPGNNTITVTGSSGSSSVTVNKS